MTRNRILSLSVLSAIGLAVVLATGQLAAAEDAVKTTTEFGITITQKDLTDAIDETQDFWRSVNAWLVGRECPAEDLKVHQDTVAFLDKVQTELHRRLFSDDEAVGQDLMKYLACRLRKVAIYRQLRGIIENDAVFATLVDRAERSCREINSLPEVTRATRVKIVLDLLSEEMAADSLSPDVVARAMKAWELQAQCMAAMSLTETGKKMIAFEAEAKKLDRSVADVLGQVTSAADWALIVRSGNQPRTLEDFQKAWAELADLRTKHRTALNAPAARR